MVQRAEIQDLKVSQNMTDFIERALDFYDETVIESDDIIILNNKDALRQGIENLLRTPTGIIDGVGMERFGTDFLTLRGKKPDSLTKQLAEKYIQDTIPQLNGKVYSIKVDMFQPTDKLKNVDWSNRFSLGFLLHVSSVYGDFDFPILL